MLDNRLCATLTRLLLLMYAVCRRHKSACICMPESHTGGYQNFRGTNEWKYTSIEYTEFRRYPPHCYCCCSIDFSSNSTFASTFFSFFCCCYCQRFQTIQTNFMCSIKCSVCILMEKYVLSVESIFPVLLRSTQKINVLSNISTNTKWHCTLAKTFKHI